MYRSAGKNCAKIFGDEERSGAMERGTLTASEAANVLGVSPQTVRNRIKAEKLEGYADVCPETGQTRYYVYEDVLEGERPKAESEDIVRRYSEDIAEEMEGLKVVNQRGFERILENQERGLDLLRECVNLLKAAAKKNGGG